MRRETVQNHKCQRQRGARDCRVTRSSRTKLFRTKARFGPHRATEADSSGTGGTGQQKPPTFPAEQASAFLLRVFASLRETGCILAHAKPRRRKGRSSSELDCLRPTSFPAFAGM